MCGLHQHASVTPVTVITLSCNKNTTNIQVLQFTIISILHVFFLLYTIMMGTGVMEAGLWRKIVCAWNISVHQQQGHKVIRSSAWDFLLHIAIECGNNSKWCRVPCEGATLAVKFGNSSWCLERYEENPYTNFGWLHMHCLQTIYTVYRLYALSTGYMHRLLAICTVYKLYALSTGYVHCLQAIFIAYRLYVCTLYRLYTLSTGYVHCLQAMCTVYRLYAPSIGYMHCL